MDIRYLKLGPRMAIFVKLEAEYSQGSFSSPEQKTFTVLPKQLKPNKLLETESGVPRCTSRTSKASILMKGSETYDAHKFKMIGDMIGSKDEDFSAPAATSKKLILLSNWPLCAESHFQVSHLKEAIPAFTVACIVSRTKCNVSSDAW